MRLKALLSILLIFILSSFLVTSCAGTKKESDTAMTSQDSEEKDLDDIEALLGISSDNSTQQAQPAKKDNGERLDLLETDEMVGQQNNSMASAALAQQDANKEDAKLKKELEDLKKQIRKKDQKIANLQNQVALKDTELEDLSKRPATRSLSMAPAGDISPEQYKDSYDQARAAFEARNYKQAIEYFEALLASSSTHSLSDNAQYWIGESHFALGQYDAAIIDFEKVLTFANSNKKADAQFKLGFCYLLKKDREKAMDEFDRLRADYPESPLNNRVEKLLARY